MRMPKEIKESISYEEVTNDEGTFKPRKFAGELLKILPFQTLLKTGEIYVYRDGYYQLLGEEYIKGIVEDFIPLDYNYTSNIESQVKRSIRAKTQIERDNFTEPAKYINLENGVYNVETDEFEEEVDYYTFRHKIPVNYDPEAEPNKVLDFFFDIVRDENVKILQEIFGYCLYRDYPIQKAIMLLGEGGNGKTTLLQLLEKFLGYDNVANPSLQALMNDKFKRLDLRDKLANINGDLDPDALTRTGTFKRLTGGDTISADKKHVQGDFTFQNYAKLIYSANELPRTDDTTDAFFRRWIIIDFPYKFTDEEDDGHKDVNENILEEITTEEEFSGLLNWALEGLKRLLENKGFSDTESTRSIKKKWLMESNSIDAFIETYTTTDRDIIITKKSFYKVYQRFCEENGLVDIEYTKFCATIKKDTPAISEQKRIDGGRVHCWRGLKLEEEPLDFDLSDTKVMMFERKKGDLMRNGGYIKFPSEEVFDEETLTQKIRGFMDRHKPKSVIKIQNNFSEEHTDREIIEALEELKRNGEISEVEQGKYLKTG